MIRRHDGPVTTAPAVRAPSDLDGIEHLDWSAAASDERPQDQPQEPFSPARRVLPWALFVLVLSLVAIGYAVVLESSLLVTCTLVLTATVLGGVAGLSVRDGRDRWVSTTRALREGLGRLGHALWS